MWQLLVKYMQALQLSTRATAAQNYKEQVLVPVYISEPLARQQHGDILHVRLGHTRHTRAFS